jgi:carbamoyl-phosphate synthase large subunit
MRPHDPDPEERTGRVRVMIAGIGGASLGTEIAKALQLASRYDVYGCDVSKTAFGLYSEHFQDTFRVNRDRYVEDVLDACKVSGARWIVPGGEQPTLLLAAARDELESAGVRLVGNDSEVIRTFADKEVTFRRLSELGIATPMTAPAVDRDSIASVGLPCIIKPATGSGGSVFVFLARTEDEASVYAHFLRSNGHRPLAQEYVPEANGEFTVGVLSLPDGRVAGSVALRRDLTPKLSVAYRGESGVISSGYSQGLIGDFPEVRRVAEVIATSIGSRGPINVQGRVRHGMFVPFEINPRFSASTYLRALAGFNEVDWFLQFLIHGTVPPAIPLRYGWYLRSLTETFVAQKDLK